MDWLFNFAVWEKVGSIGSIVGALFTLIAFGFQWKTRKHYQLLIRGPELKDDLIELNSQLNYYSELSSQERKTVLAETSIPLKSVESVLGLKKRIELLKLRFSLWWRWKTAAPDQVENYFAEIHSLIVHIRHQIRNKQVEQ